MSKSRATLITWILTITQCIVSLNITIVMPLGPQLLKDLAIPVQTMDEITGVYSLAASLSAFLACLYIDRYPKKLILAILLLALSITTIMTCLVNSDSGMIIIRSISGACSGPILAIMYAIIYDIIGEEYRGSAIGMLVSASSLASIIGVPISLVISQDWNWHMPFVVIGISGIVMWCMIIFLVPNTSSAIKTVSVAEHIEEIKSLMHNKLVLCAYATFSSINVAVFILLPNLPLHLIDNLAFPQSKLSNIYFMGGLVNLLLTNIAGKLLNFTHPVKLFVIFTCCHLYSLLSGFIFYDANTNAYIIFICFLGGMMGRNSCLQTLFSHIPPAAVRGSYLAIQSSLNNIGAAVGGYCAGMMINYQAGKLLGMPHAAIISAIISTGVILPFWWIGKQCAKKQLSKQSTT